MHVIRPNLQSPAVSRRQTPEPWLRHACLLGPVALCTALAFAGALPPRPGALSMLAAGLVALNVGLLALSAMSGLLGAAAAAAARWRRPAGPQAGAPTGRARTAILLPIYEEDPYRVFAAVAVMRQSLAHERLGAVDIFVLSDTQRPAAAAAELDAYEAFLAAHPAAATAGIAAHYRRRTGNSRRKTGNIAEFCERWGGSFDFMVVLDADSLMTGAAIAGLVGMMEATPGAGIIQSMIYPVGRGSLFARWQQFGARLYGPLLAQGVALWQGPRGSYWGHNAIIRVAPFMAHCGLPALPGPAPLGGEILCHDTVEAALMLRAGWDVWMVPAATGSFEETPTNLVDHLVRDRRWCQGNLQHIGLLRTSGLRPASLVHLGMGIAHYLSAPAFVAMLAVAALAPFALPAWLTATVAALLFGPKLASLATVLVNRERSAGFGGRRALLASAALDQVAGLLLGPVMLAFYTHFAATTLLGRVVHWDAQVRDDRGLGWAATARSLATPLGVAACAAVAAGAPWLLPGLALAVPLAVWSSRSSLGQAARRAGLFTTPEEAAPPAELAALPAVEAALRRHTARQAAPALPQPAPGRVVVQMLRRSPSARPARLQAVA